MNRDLDVMASEESLERPVLQRGEVLEFVPRDLDRNETPESGIVLENTELTEQPEKTMSTLTEDTSRNVLPPNSLINFNLADPDEITRMLETFDLTDEDTDVLLQEAYNINKKLKEILRRREEGIELDPSEEALLHGQTVVVVPGSAIEPRSGTADPAMNRDPAFSKKEALPPIKSSDNESTRVASAIYSAKLGRRPVPPSSGMIRGRGMPTSRHPSGVHRSPPSAISRGSRNPSAAGGRKSNRGGSSTAKGKTRQMAPAPIQERPPWNDRFSV